MTGNNQVHVDLFNSINASLFHIPYHVGKRDNSIFKGVNFLRSSMSFPINYEVLLSESCYYYPAFRKKIGLFTGKVINMNSSPVLYTLSNNGFSKSMNFMLNNLIRYVDGFMIQGKYGVEIIQRLGIDVPYSIFYPFIHENRYAIAKKSIPTLNSKNITIFVTGDYFCKGLDILLGAFKKVASVHPLAKLNIVGNVEPSGIIERFSRGLHRNVIFHGWINDPRPILEDTSLYVHPGRGETFGVSVLESMLSGVPCIVSSETGSKEVVSKVDRNFVVPLDQDAVATQILKYFDLSDSKKQKLSIKAREAAKPFREKTMIQLFKKQFYSLLEDVS